MRYIHLYISLTVLRPQAWHKSKYQGLNIVHIKHKVNYLLGNCIYILMAVLRAARLKLVNIPDIIIIQKIQGWLSNRKINCIYIPLTGLRATGLKQVKLLGHHYHTNKTQGWLSNGVMNCTYILWLCWGLQAWNRSTNTQKMGTL